MVGTDANVREVVRNRFAHLEAAAPVQGVNRLSFQRNCTGDIFTTPESGRTDILGVF